MPRATLRSWPGWAPICATRPSVSKADIAPLSEAYLARAKARDENIGADVCFSGANGGTHCGEITDANVTRGFKDGTSTRDLTCVKMPAGNIVGGDSGGPVLSTYSNGKVHAWGQTVGTQADANCAAVHTPVLAISAAVGATILVNP